jgi:hypothetical protein
MVMLLASGIVHAELKFVANFEGMSGTPDGQACNGVLGGVIDTESEATGNASFQNNGGSNTLSVIGHSSGGMARAVGVGGISNPIDKGETGVCFFRFSVAAGNIRPHFGLVTDNNGNPVNATNTQDPKTVPAGFKLVGNGPAMDMYTLDGATVLEAGLVPGQWYNCWIVADNEADTFDLYLSDAAGSGGAATLPNSQDLVKAGIPFTVVTTAALAGLIGANPTGSGQAARIYIDEIWWDGDQGIGAVKKAGPPSPADKATEVARDAVLSWKPVAFAATHNVYFGTGQADVNAASATDPMGVLVSTGSDANTYDPPGVLEYGQTYYWRVDEVNTVDQKVFRGSIWSFTVEAAYYPIQNIAATASGSSADQGPGKTVDGSGLNAGDLHDAVATNMWLSDGGEPAWIQYAFDDVYKLHEMWVWNSNQSIEPFAGLGAKDVLVEYSTDGVAWTTLAGVPQFAKAPGGAGYAHNTTIDFGGAVAKYVKLVINSAWGEALPQVGLSEVRFYYKPVLATDPQPATGGTDVAADVVLSWRTGHEAASHTVYLGTDANTLSLAGTVTQSSFAPTSMDLGTTYYWRVDEVNEAETPALWTGKVWSFSTSEYTIIDDMESYTDDEGHRIYDAWLDGWSVAANGSQVGNPTEPWAEKTIVHGGKQSMPLFYNNTSPVNYSEAELSFSSPQDWTANAADTLSLWFRGSPVGFLELASDHILMNGMGTDIYNTTDQGRFVYKQLTGNGTIIARVDRLDAVDPWSKAGVMIRQNLDPGSVWAMSVYAPGNGWRIQTRPTTGGNGVTDSAVATTAQLDVRAPVWIKLERTGSVFSAYYATADAPTTWIASPLGPQTVAMSDPVCIGLACTSHVATAVTQAEFSAIATTGNVTGNWQSVDLGIPQPVGNTLDALYVTVKDSAGKSTTIKHPDALAVTAGTWQQWMIPLSTLTGISPSKVGSLIIGIGDRTNPQHGKGEIYVDDVAVGRPAQ